MFFWFSKTLFFEITPSSIVKSSFSGILGLFFELAFDIFFRFCSERDFYAETTDVGFYEQIIALSGPRVCLGHLNQHVFRGQKYIKNGQQINKKKARSLDDNSKNVYFK